MDKKIEAMSEVRQALKMGLPDQAILSILAHRGFGPAMALVILNAAREP